MKSSQNHIPALLSALVFVLGALFLFGIGLVMGAGALASFLAGKEVQAKQTIFLIAFGFEGIILLIAAFFSFQKFLQKPAADQNMTIPISNGLIAVFAIVTSVSILIGYWISGIKAVDWLLLPILTIPVVVLPLGILWALGTKGLPLGTRWQTWNALGLGMALTPLVLFMLEAFVGIIILFIVVAYVVTQPELSAELQQLSRQITVIGTSSEAALELLAPFLVRPGVIVIALIYMAVLVPVLEELFKPLGVWVFAGKLEQAQGFTLGALSGAAYALIETVGVSGQTNEWAVLLFTRIGTGLLHITTSALMGAAIVLVWRERRYLRLLGTYALAVLLHGLWNTLAVLFSFASLAESLKQQSLLSTLQPALVVAIFSLAVVLFLILVLSNRKMRKAVPAPETQAAIPNESTDTGETL